jgi:hypothetical protein
MHISGMGPPTSGCYLAPLVTPGGHYDRADPSRLCHRSRGTSPTDIPLSYRATDAGDRRPGLGTAKAWPENDSRIPDQYGRRCPQLREGCLESTTYCELAVSISLG